jgi:asparagine synthase (glutamine-hydrolysing)
MLRHGACGAMAIEGQDGKDMCGIAGIVSLGGAPVDPSEIESMCRVMTHRGPDEDGFYVDSNVGMGMRRLRIIDLEGGRQPVHNEDRTIWTVFNGEIYNYQELRQRLISRGHKLYTSTDTEVLVHLYEDFGERMVQFLRGMFALAIWDTRNQRLFLARDRVGIKPLYYAMAGERFCFASELKALLTLPDIPRDIDWRALGGLCATLTTPHDQSIIRGARKLRPGHWMSVSLGSARVTVAPYWDVQFVESSTQTEAALVEELRHLLDESVRLHMISDVPLGAFLSGGVDSSAVVATMTRASSRPIRTFTIGFDEQDFNEAPAAREVARALGTEHHEEIVNPDALKVIDKLVWHLDEPFGDSSAIPTYMVSQLASRSVTVVLSGDGGDELFAGYDRYLTEMRERRYDRLPPFIRMLAGGVGRVLPEFTRGKNFLNHFSKTGAERYADASTLFRLRQFPRLFTPDVLPHVIPEVELPDATRTRANATHWLSALQYGDLKSYLPLDILTKVDRMSMAHSIEARVPLLDHKLIEFAARIPPDLQIRDGRSKHILKSAMKGVLSETALNRPKRGFAVPLGAWFKGKLEDFAHDVLLSTRSRQRGIFDPAYVEKLLYRHAKGRSLDLHLWTLMSCELWCRAFLDQAPERLETQAVYARHQN